eukprot:1356657-Amorphochlora_amoeboformis.AAC.2
MPSRIKLEIVGDSMESMEILSIGQHPHGTPERRQHHKAPRLGEMSYYDGTWIGKMDALGKKTEWREKTGKVIQYSAKLAADVLAVDFEYEGEAVKRLKALSKLVSASRKIFKLGKFLKRKS